MRLIDYFSPRSDNMVVTGLLLSSIPLQGGPSGFTLTSDGSIHRVNKATLFGGDTVDREWSFNSQFIQKSISDNPIILCAARHTWAFGSSVSDAEADVWDRPIKEHPDSIQVFEMISMCWACKKQWIVEYDHLQGVPQITKIHEIDSDDTPDPRFSPETGISKEIAEAIGITIEKEKIDDRVVRFRKR